MLKNLPEKTKLLIARTIAVLILTFIAGSLAWIASDGDSPISKEPVKTEQTTSTVELTTGTVTVEETPKEAQIKIPSDLEETSSVVDLETTFSVPRNNDDPYTSMALDLLKQLPKFPTIKTPEETPDYPTESILVPESEDIPSLSEDETTNKTEEKETLNEENEEKNVIKDKEKAKTVVLEKPVVVKSTPKPKATPKPTPKPKVTPKAKATPKVTPKPTVTPAPVQRFAIEIYGAAWCPACISLKNQMAQRGYIEGTHFNYIDIEKESVPEDIKAYMRRSGAIPVVKFNNTIDNGAALRSYYKLK